MRKVTHLSLALSGLAVALLAVACGERPAPEQMSGPSFGIKPPSPPPKKEGGCANFRLTGGGRTDERNHTGFAKSTPESHDFATFGFQARPTAACPPTDGSGNIEWQDHNTAAFGGGFGFHGRVTYFTTPTETGLEGQCGLFGGSGRLNPRNGSTVEGVPFEVNHACDVAEPGVGRDHIKITIGPIGPGGPTYSRHGLLSGGNIQWHRLTGNN